MAYYSSFNTAGCSFLKLGAEFGVKGNTKYDKETLRFEDWELRTEDRGQGENMEDWGLRIED